MSRRRVRALLLAVATADHLLFREMVGRSSPGTYGIIGARNNVLVG